MRTFVVYSQTASTAPFHKDLKGAGRWDILLHSIISALFISNDFRNDTTLHLILMGPPTSPRHISISYHKDNTISKKNLKKLIEIALRRYRSGEETKQIHPGVFIDDKSIEQVLKEKEEENKNLFVLDYNGENIKKASHKSLEDGVFILGDFDGFKKRIKKLLKKNCQKLSLGPQIYFTSQSITIINYELDNL